MKSHSGFLLLVLLLLPKTGKTETYAVGKDKPYQTLGSLPALHPGDVVEIAPGTYRELHRWTASGTAQKPIVVRGVGATRPVLDGTGFNPTGAGSVPRALFQIEGDHLVVENLEFRNAHNDSNNGAGIRITGAKHTIVRDCKISHCDMGMMSNDNDDLLVERSEFAFNGEAEHFNGYAHNLYLGGDRTTVRFCYIHDAFAGLNFKTRGRYTELLYNVIADSNEGEVSLVDGETKGDACHAVLIGNVIVSKANRTGNSGKFIDFGQDMGGQRKGTLFLYHNTLVAGDSRIQFLWASTPDARIVASNNIFFGSDQIAGDGRGKIEGTHNWLPVTATLLRTFTASQRTLSPGFRNVKARDFHLDTDSPCHRAGTTTLTYRDAEDRPRSGLPRYEIVVPLKARRRPAETAPTLGAYHE